MNLNNIEVLKKSAIEAVSSVGAQIAKVSYFEFQPHGITLCLILKESHFIISTWPEHKIAIINIFLCNDQMSTRSVWDHFAKCIRPTQEVCRYVEHKLDLYKKAA
jgi:S-adenosylmethionine decarboxylase